MPKPSNAYTQLLYDMEVHDAEGIRQYFESGGDPNEIHDGVSIFSTMVEMYFRSPRFQKCIQVFIDYGLTFADQPLLAVLNNDSATLDALIRADPAITEKKYSAFRNAYTSLEEATLLHYCAEYNHTDCAETLVAHGSDVNARTGFDEFGFGGHTPVFHTVCQNQNNSYDMLNFLIGRSADLTVMVKGLFWGKGYDWETFLPAVNPLSYAMMGLLPQMHRDLTTTQSIVSLLLKQAYGINFSPPNVPNKYLGSK